MRSSASLCFAGSSATSFSITFSISSATSSAALSAGWRKLASRMQATTRPNVSSGNILISYSREHETHMVAREHRVLGFRPPATLREDAIVRHALAEHADLFQDPDAGGILQRHVRLDAMQLQIVETEGEQAQCDLGGKSASRVNVVHAKA